MKTVSIIEGWAGGPKLSNNFRQALTEHGFVCTKNIAEAKIIIAHSTGCYNLPIGNQSELVVLINPPYWPGSSLIKRFLRMNRNENLFIKHSFGRKKYIMMKFWEIYYIFAKPSYTWSAVKNHIDLSFIKTLAETRQKIILIRNTMDEFCSPEIKNKISDYKNIRFVQVNGFHSNYYFDPRPYIEIIKKHL